MENNNQEHWDITIEPNNNLFHIDFRQLWHYRDLLILFVRRDFVAFYKQTVLGPLWFFLQPMFTTIIYVIVFSNLGGISTDGLPPVLFYLPGITIWTYFSDSLIKTSTVFKDNVNIFGKVYFPRLILPASIVVSNLFKLATQLLLLVIIMLWYHVKGVRIGINAQILLFPFLILLMAIQGLGSGMIISSLTTRYRDLALLVVFGVQLLMYVSPVIYPMSSVSGKLYKVLSLNPLSSIIEGIRYGLFGKGSFSFLSLLYSVIFSLLILVIGVLIFNKVEKKFVDTI